MVIVAGLRFIQKIENDIHFNLLFYRLMKFIMYLNSFFGKNREFLNFLRI